MEVKIEVPVPDLNGRKEILKIKFEPLRSSRKLSQAVCDAIDRNYINDNKTGISHFRTMPYLRKPNGLNPSRRHVRVLKLLNDLAPDTWTGGFTGANIEGLV